MRFELDPPLTDRLREDLVSLWLEVSNAGGAVGFVPPVTLEQVLATAESTFPPIDQGHDRLLAGFDDEGRPAAMLIFASRRFNLTEHWRTIRRVMVHPSAQGRGYGVKLMREGARIATELGWEALTVSVRGGTGLERFYASVGYREIGRRPGALRLSPGDDRDEILMWLDLPTTAL